MCESDVYESSVQTSEHLMGDSARNSMGNEAMRDRDDRASCSSARELGRRGERAAVRFLKDRGYEILETNWTCFAGEADIIARDGDTLCFVEVKTRSDAEKGFPAEAVHAKKRARYEKIAASYLKTYEVCDTRVRFDVISILVLSEHRAFLRFHINAFGAGE